MKALFTSTLIALVTLGAAPVQAAGDHAGHGMAMQATRNTNSSKIGAATATVKISTTGEPTSAIFAIKSDSGQPNS